MNTPPLKRRALALTALVGAAVALTAGPANAAYTARVDAGTLRITGDAASDKLVLVASSAAVELDVGADGTADFTFDRSTFGSISVDAGRGNDEVRTVGSFVDLPLTVDGNAGDDTIFGSNVSDTLVGGAGNDFVDGQQGVDTALLGTGNDRFQWDPGDGSDTVEGQGGVDTLDFNGSAIGEIYDVAANGPRVRLTRNIASITLDLDDVEALNLRSFGGADLLTVNDLTGTDMRTVDADLNLLGGAGDGQIDTVTARGTAAADSVAVGSSAGKVIVSGLFAQTRVTASEAALDTVDVATLGGTDTITTGIGTTGPESVNVDGGDDADTLRYSGTSAGDGIHVVANGAEAAVDSPGFTRVDALVESLVVLGLGGNDTITAVGNLAALTAITMDGGAGNDSISGSNGADTLIGDAGDDFVDGQQGSDVALLGTGNDRFQWDPGDGNDVVEGQLGTDTLDFNGSGANEIYEISANGPRARFTRNVASIVMDLDDVELLAPHPFGGTDLVNVNDLAGTDVKMVDVDLAAFGGAGDAAADTVAVRGTSGADNVVIGSSAGAPLVSGLAAQVRVSGGEAASDNVNVETLGGSDTVTAAIGIAGVTPVNVYGGEDADTLRYSGTAAADAIQVVANGAEAAVDAAGTARIDAVVESLVVLGLGGNDTITGVGNLAALTAITMDGGAGDDTVWGGNGADTLIGGTGNDSVDGQQGADVALLGGGNDRFQWDPGDGSDVVEGQGGADALDFNGSAASELIELAANGPRVRLTRNVGSVVLDLDDVESAVVRTFGGTDSVTVGNLAGTDLRTVDVDLALLGGAGDGLVDTVTVDGTAGADAVQVTNSGSQVRAGGLFAQTRIVGSEPDIDWLVVRTLAGNDSVAVAPGVAALIVPVVDLGADE
jgi:Ca2+-binding RTX toxin-like protein